MPMRVLVVFNRHRFGGGADVMADATVRLLREHGVEVETLERDSAQLPRGLRGRLMAACSSFYEPGALAELRAVLTRFRPDVVHAHEVYPSITPWMFPVCRRAGVPVVATLHDYRLSCPIATHFREGGLCTACLRGSPWNALRWNCRDQVSESAVYAARTWLARAVNLYAGFVSQFVVPSDFLKSWFVESGMIPSERITVVPNFSDIPVQESVVPGDYVAYAGRHAVEKGVHILLEAIADTRLPLEVAGDFSEYPDAGRRLTEHVRFRGLLKGDERIEFYRRARMTVVPSLWNETFGLVAIESMACGTPVISSDIGALSEVVGNSGGGMLVRPGDAKALASAMRELWYDAGRCRKAGQDGMCYVRETYSASHHAQGLLRVYEEIVSRNTQN